MSGFKAYLIFSVVGCLVLSVTCEMTVDVAYSLLQRRIENLEVDTFSGMAKMNDRMDSMEMLIKSFVTTQTPPSKDSFSVTDNKQVTGNREVRKFKTTILKAFASEKQLIRNELEKCETQFNDFKQNINVQMRQINESHESIRHEHVVTVARVNDSLIQSHLDTDLKLQGFVDTFETSLNATEVNLEAVTSKQEEIQTLTETIINDLKSHDMDINTIQSSLTSLEDRHDKDVSSIRSSVNSLENKKVGFTARQKKQQTYTSWQIIVFNKLTSNYGGGYNTSSGIFTAPKTGLYLFQFNVEGCGKSALYVNLIADGEYKVTGHVNKGPNSVSNAAVAYLNKGHTAYVRVSFGSTYCIGAWQSSFTGVLIN